MLELCNDNGWTLTVAPYITEFSTPPTIPRGGKVTLKCVAKGFPIPLVSWQRIDGISFDTSRLVVSESVDDLEVTSIVEVSPTIRSDSGNYSCSVESPVPQYDPVVRSATILIQGST